MSSGDKLGQETPFSVIFWRMAGPCVQRTEIMVIGVWTCSPLASFGAPDDGSLWHMAQRFAVKTFSPFAALALAVMNCRSQTYATILRISSEPTVGAVTIFGAWFHMSAA